MFIECNKTDVRDVMAVYAILPIIFKPFQILDNGVHIPLPLVSDRLTGIGDAVLDLKRATASNVVYVATNPFAAANCQLSQQII